MSLCSGIKLEKTSRSVGQSVAYSLQRDVSKPLKIFRPGTYMGPELEASTALHHSASYLEGSPRVWRTLQWNPGCAREVASYVKNVPELVPYSSPLETRNEWGTFGGMKAEPLAVVATHKSLSSGDTSGRVTGALL